MKKELYLLTGFLGAGKTSLLLHLLNHVQDRKIGIIQNEFGKLSIDGEILRRGEITMVEINRGSIFCSCLKLNFVQALAELGQMDLDTVFVESSGLADPSNLEEILEAVKVLAGDVYRVMGVICLVDAVNFPQQLQTEETVQRQIAHCHMAVINKTDLVDEAQVEALRAQIRALNPRCRITGCVRGAVDPGFLGEDLTALQWAESEESLNRPENKPKSISLETGAVLTPEELEAFLRRVLPDCYRIKGCMHLTDGWQQVDVVEALIERQPAEARELSQLVFLSKIGPQVIRTVDAAWRELLPHPMKLRN